MYQDKLKIFLAEDDVDDRSFFKDAFEEVKVKHTLEIFEDGMSLMDYLNKQESVLPDIIFMDINMPGLSGMECLREIRSSQNLSEIVVAIYSTSASPANIEEAFIEGANVYITKPDEFSALKKIITEITNISWQYVTDGLNRQNFMLSY
ncbi:response regulator [Flavobacterium sp. D11R37]|uniref:response regulator n=1 Tax=Flavobacterium coralii TaxID=2838017 RepID=UPI001CA774B4|nr:response regulator [Flavobacterium coralii]MBY8962705.1 response regulator [Flavobacterium coralii]